MPILLSGLVFYTASQLSRDTREARRAMEWRRWIEEEVVDSLRRGEVPQSLDRAPVTQVFIVDDTGRIVAASHPGEIPPGEESRTVIRLVRTREDREYRVIYTRPETELTHPFRNTWRILAVGIVFATMLLAGGIAGTAIVRDFERRLRFTSGAIHRIAAGDLETPVDVTSGDEVAELAAGLNHMRRTLLDSREQRRRLLMGVSHDLNTPLTTILGYLEAFEDDLYADEAARRQSLSAMRRKAELLQSRIEELIELARVESGDRGENTQQIPLQQFLEELCREKGSELEADGRPFTADIRLSAEARLWTDRSLLERALENLFHNARRYTRPGDPVRLMATPAATNDEPARFEIRLDDGGPGFTEMAPEEAFELFRRGSQTRNESGFGLGLPTVRSILEMQGMTIRAEHSPLGGASFVISGVLAQM